MMAQMSAKSELSQRRIIYSAPLAHQSTRVLSRQDFDVCEERHSKEILDFARGSEAISFLKTDRPFKPFARVEGDSRAIPFSKLRFCLSEQSSCHRGPCQVGRTAIRRIWPSSSS